MKNLIFLAIIITLSQGTNISNIKLQEKKNETSIFPHKLWIYWDNNIDEAPIFTQLCINNIRYYTKISNWQLILLNKTNVNNYLSKKSQ